MKKTIPYLLLFLCCLSVGLTSAQKQAYVIYNAKGKKVSYKKMLKQLTKKDIVLFGEIHNDPIAHWLQFELTTDLQKKRSLLLGAEMIEADNQQPLTSYLKGEIDFPALDSLARLWSNYATDYAPLVNIAKKHQLPFIATNIPRRYARMVHRQGFPALDSLSPEDKAWIAPLPIAFDPDLPTYQKILTMMGDHGTLDLVKAQAIKDATMAHFILKNYQTGKLFLHFNGSFHSNYYEGILWYLKRQEPALNYGTIATVSQKQVNKLESDYQQIADFIICVDEDMTKTF